MATVILHNTVMDWPVAATLITAISTVGVALIKFVPKRPNGNGLNSRESGMVLARLDAIERRLERIEVNMPCKSS